MNPDFELLQAILTFPRRRADNLEKVIAVESWATYGQALHKLCLVRAVQGRIQTVEALPTFQADQALKVLVAEVV